MVVVKLVESGGHSSNLHVYVFGNFEFVLMLFSRPYYY